jgi:hypothetical protein
VTYARPHALRDARDPWIVLGLFVLAVIIPGVVSTMAGAILIPHNDDFGYRRVATTLFEEGRIQFTGWTVMTLLGQIFFTAPFMWLLGGSPWAFALSSATLVGIGIVASYHLARRVLTPPRATFALLIVLLIPGVLRDTTAFMTDLPAYAGEMLCLALGAAAIHRTDDEHRWRWLVASLVAGCWAFSIREFALAAPVAVVAVAFMSDPARRRARYAVAGIAVLAACAAIYLVISDMPGQAETTLRLFGPDKATRTVHASSTLAFLLAPAIVLGAATWGPIWRQTSDPGARRRAIVGAVVGIVVAGVVYANDVAQIPNLSATKHLQTIVGNEFARVGSPDAVLLAGTRPAAFPFAFWDLISFLAILAGFAGFAALGAALGAGGPRLLRAVDPRRRPTELGSVIGLLVVFSAIYGGGIVLFGIAGLMFDRYLWPLAFTLSVLLLWRPADAVGPVSDRAVDPGTADGRRSRLPLIAACIASAMLAVTATISVILALNSVAFDAALWKAGEDQVARGIAPMSIDAGFDWLGQHAITDSAQIHAPLRPNRARYTRLWPSYRQCVVVSNSKIDWPGLVLQEDREKAYRMFLLGGAWRALYIYQSTDPACAA